MFWANSKTEGAILKNNILKIYEITAWIETMIVATTSIVVRVTIILSVKLSNLKKNDMNPTNINN